MIVRQYANTYPRQVAGLVLVDALNEKLVPLLGPDYWARYVAFQYVPVPGFEELPRLRDVRLRRPAPISYAARQGPGRCEASCRCTCSRKGQSFGVPDDAVGFSTATLDLAWRKAQNWLARLVPHTPHVIAAGQRP